MTHTLLALVACGPTAPTSSPTTTDPTGDTGSTEERPTLRSPDEAIDLDPDPTVLHVQLRAAPHVWPDGREGYAYNGQIPGPTLRARVGDTLVVELDNQLGMDTSIHWHGLHVPYAMDGAGWQAAPVGPGERFTYRFTLEQAGTFWYHPHFNTEGQVDGGLYGALIVEDPDEPAVDDELVLVVDGPAEVEAGERDPTVDPTPSAWLVNGMVEPVWRPPAGSRVRIRLINVSNAAYLALDDVEVIAHDQGLLGAPETAVVLGPGDRAELDWAVTDPRALYPRPWSASGPAVFPTRPLFTVEPEGDAPPPLPVDWPFAPEPPTPDPGRTDLRYTFAGSPAEGWTINGQTWPAITPDTAALGDTLILEIRNVSPAHHPYHLHGMSFEVLTIDGVAPAYRQVEDTLDVGVQQTVRLRILADNPGAWMSHCHILPHAEDGMMTVLQVE